ncbi:hypothetical protein ES703_82393 [subsurface metagenome]
MPKIEGIHIRRVRRQHSSVVVVIPVLVRRALGIKAGDYVIFNGHKGDNIVELMKWEKKGVRSARRKKHSSRKNKGRRPRAKARGRR